MKKILHVVFEKYGLLKLFGSAILSLFFLWLFYNTGYDIFKIASIVFGSVVGLYAIVLFTFAWIINPYKDIKDKIQRRKE